MSFRSLKNLTRDQDEQQKYSGEQIRDNVHS